MEKVNQRVMITKRMLKDALLRILESKNIDKINNLKVISIGPITTQSANNLNVNVYKEAEVSSIDGIINSILNDEFTGEE